jgi:hypothetical protein
VDIERAIVWGEHERKADQHSADHEPQVFRSLEI